MTTSGRRGGVEQYELVAAGTAVKPIIISSTVDPRTGAGTPAPISSLLLFISGVGDSTLFIKFGGADTAWRQVPRGGPLVWGESDISSGADTRFLPVGSDTPGPAPMTADFTVIAPHPGVIQNLFATHNSAAGNGASVDYILVVNTVPTLLTVSLATGAIGSAGNTTDKIAIAQGDRLDMIADKPLAIGGGMVLVQVSAEYV